MSKRHKKTPPSFATWLLSKFVDSTFLEEFNGDLEEMYQERLETSGKLSAWFMYWIDAFHLMIGFSSAGITKPKSNVMMITSMYKIAWRSALRQKQFTILNVAGLTIGIATFLIIGLYVYDETTYDTFHANGDRIYRINQPMIWGNWDEQFASTGPNVAEALREDAPEFEQVTRILKDGEKIIRIQGSGQAALFNEAKYFAAEENFFRIFSFEFLSGDPLTALNEPMSMVVTSSTGQRYFGNTDPIGKMMEVKEKDGSWTSFTVTGVMKDIPVKSHLQFDMLVSLSSYSDMMKENGWKWIWTGFSTYGMVKEGTDIATLTERIQSIPPKWAAATTERIFNQKFNEFTSGKDWRLYLQPLREIYLASSPDAHRFGPSGNYQFVTIFASIAVLVLFLSCINFMNLSTARSSRRAKEVGVRKVLGSQRAVLVKQFIVESILYAAIGTVCSLAVVQLSLNAFNTLAEKSISLWPHLINPYFIGSLIVFILTLGLIAGSYPAFYLSSFNPIEILKGKTPGGFKRMTTRNVLVVFQFTVSIALIICTFFVQKQLAYTSALDVGFVKENVLQIHNVEQMGSNVEVLKTTLARNPSFEQVARSFSLPPYVWEGERYKAFGPDNPVVDIMNLRADDNYLSLLGVEFLAGRNFDPERVNDKYGVILNEEAVRIFGWGSRDTYQTDSPVGKFVLQAFDKEAKLEVIGVVRNFNFNSVRKKIDPLMILHYENDLFWNYGQGRSYISIKLDPEKVKNAADIQRSIESVRDEIAKIDSSIPFEFSFMDQEFENTFRAEQRLGMILSLFTALALVIACLGLYGLAAFSAEQRIKELGIRKVLGANLNELVFLFSSEFTKLVLIAILLATPVAYFLVDHWLTTFAYHTSIDAWVFAVAAGVALTIAFITISYQSFCAAGTNPVDTLRNE